MTEVKITPEQGSDTQAHIDAMAAKADNKAPETPAAAADQKPEAAAEERPDWLPEKFKSPEDMAKAYAALEQKQGGKPDEGAQGGEDADNAGQEEVNDAANKAVEAAGLDMDALGTKIVQNGDLDTADYDALAKQGISKEMVSSFVAGQQALADKMVDRMHETVGGKDQFEGLLSWAGESLDAEEIKAFNNTIDNGSEAAVKLALQGLAARQKAEAGPSLIGGKRGGAGSGEVFRSTAEVTKAMSDPRYARDPAYRADVMAKLSRSSVI